MSKDTESEKTCCGESCGCFGGSCHAADTPPEYEDGMHKYSPYRPSKSGRNRISDALWTDALSDSGSFYSVEPDQPTKYSAGTQVDPKNTFNMGSTIPHRDEGVEGMCWSHSGESHFKVRVGPDYKRNGLKAPSLDALYAPVGVDFLKSDTILSNIAPHLMFPEIGHYYDPACGFPALLIVNTQIPLAMPSLFASSDNDPGVSIVGYYRIKKETVEWAMNLSSPAVPPVVHVFKRLLDRGYSEKSLAFKAIGLVHELEKQGLPMMSLLTKYNGKPVLVTASSAFHFGKSPYQYLEIDYNVRKWSLLARSTLVQLVDRLKTLSCHVGYLVEATNNEDMPERMLAATTVHNIDVSKAKFIKF